MDELETLAKPDENDITPTPPAPTSFRIRSRDEAVEALEALIIWHGQFEPDEIRHAAWIQSVEALLSFI